MIGGAEEDRTPDLRVANATLSQLSYDPTLSVSINTDFTSAAAKQNYVCSTSDLNGTDNSGGIE